MAAGRLHVENEAPANGDAPSVATGTAPGAVRLPIPMTPLVGRADALATLAELIRPSAEGGFRSHLVTVTGPGGVGKTRLALEAARAVTLRFPGGVTFVDLSAVGDPERVLPVVAESLGASVGLGQSPVDTVVAALGSVPSLLILDNLEQVIGVASAIGAVIAAQPAVTILATSRVPLRLRAERLLPLAPLETPTADADDTPADFTTLATVPAVALFLDRVRAANPSFDLTLGNANAIAAICRRLDGLPLALELAATRAVILPPERMLPRLDRALTFLADGPRDLPERQQTLRDTLAWSESLLAEPARLLFRRLGVFSGGFDLPALEAVAIMADAPHLNGDPLSVLADLLDASLIRRVDPLGAGADDLPRYAPLETVREYAAERLAASGERDDVGWTHLKHFVTLLEDAVGYLRTPEQVTWLARLQRDGENIRAALTFGLTTDDETRCPLVTRLAVAFGRWSEVAGFQAEALNRLRRALDRWPTLEPNVDAPADPDRAAVIAAGLCEAGWLAQEVGDLDESERLTMAGLELYRALGDGGKIAEALGDLGGVVSIRGDYVRADALQVEARETALQAGDQNQANRALANRAVNAFRASDAALATAILGETVHLFREQGDTYRLGLTLDQLGTLAERRGDRVAAEALRRECIVLGRQLGDFSMIGQALTNLGSVLISARRYDEAESVLDEAREIFTTSGNVWQLAGVHGALAHLALRRGQREPAILAIERQVRIYLDMDQPHDAAGIMEQAATSVANLTSLPEAVAASAARMLGAADRVRVETATAPDELLADPIDLPASRAALSRRLGEERLVTEWERGAMAPLAERVADTVAIYAFRASQPDVDPLASPHQSGANAPAAPALAPGGLTPRELDVLRLVAQGITSGQIADALFLSERTVHTHLNRIYRKIDVSSRAGATRWALEHGVLGT